jgi:hypothetical protein
MSKGEQGEQYQCSCCDFLGDADSLMCHFSRAHPEKLRRPSAAASLPESQPAPCPECGFPGASFTLEGVAWRWHFDSSSREYVKCEGSRQPAPEMDYEKDAELLVKMARYVAIKSAEKMVSEWLRAHDARVQPAVSILMDALKSISDPPKDACGCDDHECAECCVNADYHCPVCIAGHAIANFNKSDARVQPSSVAGTMPVAVKKMRDACHADVLELIQRIIDTSTPGTPATLSMQWLHEALSEGIDGFGDDSYSDNKAESALKESSR